MVGAPRRLLDAVIAIEQVGHRRVHGEAAGDTYRLERCVADEVVLEAHLVAFEVSSERSLAARNASTTAADTAPDTAAISVIVAPSPITAASADQPPLVGRQRASNTAFAVRRSTTSTYCCRSSSSMSRTRACPS